MLLHTIISIIMLGSGSPQCSPSALWNPFVEDYGMRSLEEVEPEMRGEYLAYWYFSEVYNGGHMQYFLNKHDFPWHETADAMEAMGATDHAKVLRKAIAIWQSEERRIPQTAEEYVEDAQEGDLDELDSAMYRIEPALECYVEKSLVRKAERKKAALTAN